MTKINIEETYNTIKEDVSKDYKSYILNSKVYLDRYRKDRFDDIFLGYIEEPGAGYRYIITIYVRDRRSGNSLKSNIYLDNGYKMINEDVKRKTIK